MKPINEFKEIEIFFFIDAIGGHLWLINHEYGKGNISEDEYARMTPAILELKKNQLEALEQLPKFGINDAIKDGEVTDSYWKWYRTWNSWKSRMRTNEWREVDNILSIGITEEQEKEYKKQAFGE